jgi:hypothetical protein
MIVKSSYITTDGQPASLSWCQAPLSGPAINFSSFISCYSHAKQLIEDTIRRNASPIRLEQPDKERMGGSSSSLNSSASDESNRFSGEF